MLERRANLLVFRTFSKRYGLAAFRVGGYLCGGEARVYAVTALLTLPGLALLLPLGARLGPGALAGEENRPPSRRDILDNLGKTPILLLGANLLAFAAATRIFFFIKPYAVSLGLPWPGLFFTVSTVATIAVRLLARPYYDRLPRRLTALLAMLALGARLGAFRLGQESRPLFRAGPGHGLCRGLALPLANASLFLRIAAPFPGHEQEPDAFHDGCRVGAGIAGGGRPRGRHRKLRGPVPGERGRRGGSGRALRAVGDSVRGRDRATAFDFRLPRERRRPSGPGRHCNSASLVTNKTIRTVTSQPKPSHLNRSSKTALPTLLF